MSMISRASILLTAAFVAATRAAAQEPPAPAPIPAPAPAPPSTKLTLDLGFVNAAGNTEVTTLSFAENLSYKAKQWEFKEVAAVIYGRTDTAVTAEQYKVDGRIDRQLVAVLHFFVGGTYERNRFAGIARRFEEYAGFAVRLIDLPTDLWTLEAGSSVNQQQSTTGSKLNFAAIRTAMLYRHNFTKSAYLQQTVETIPNLDNTTDIRVNSETSLVAPVAGRAAIKLSYVLKYDNLPEPGFQKSDRILTTALQIVF